MRAAALLTALLVLAALPLHVQADVDSGAARPAQVVAGTDGADAAALDAACAPPCGWIIPIIDLHFPDRPTDCMPVPTKDAPVVLTGTLRWYWEISEDGHYLNDPNQPIEITLGGTSSNPSYIGLSFAPESFTLNTADLFNPEYMKTEGQAPNQRVWFWFEAPVELTLTRTGDPTPEEQERLQNRNGVGNLFAKAKSSASGETFKESFGIEEFRFETWTQHGADGDGKNGGNQATPAALALLLVALLFAVAVRRR
jgi:MYXO-CTERM domain-containing protein